jgi:GT2 family glycosyltransferase
VIIPCRGRVADLLMQQLDALAGQDFEGQWELLIADNGIVDDLIPLLGQYGDLLPRVRIVAAADRVGRGYAINRAAEVADSPRLILLDSDDMVTPSYLRETVTALQQHEFVGTRLDSVWLNPGWLQSRRRPMQEVQLERTFGRRPSVVGAGMALTRSAFERVGGFDDDLLAAEDLDVSFRLQQIGVRPFFASAAVVRFRYRKGWWAILRQERLYSRNEARLRRKHRALDRRRLGQTVTGWRDLLLAVLQVPTRSGRARLATTLGATLGRIEGSIRYRVLHL